MAAKLCPVLPSTPSVSAMSPVFSLLQPTCTMSMYVSIYFIISPDEIYLVINFIGLKKQNSHFVGLSCGSFLCFSFGMISHHNHHKRVLWSVIFPEKMLNLKYLYFTICSGTRVKYRTF